jgi:DNA-binding transcriptional ArsR family regulator
MTTIDISQMRQSACDASSLMKALGHEERLLLLCQLSQQEMCVSDIEQALNIQQPSLSQQLCILRKQGLVDTRKEGKYVYYHVTDAKALSLLQTLYQLYCKKH